MATIIIGAVILILCGAILGFLFAPEDFPRSFCAAWGASAVSTILIIIAVIYVAAHFASKYW